jgi:uncharacterized NAD(P)/FAD-binding protein YdhS
MKSDRDYPVAIVGGGYSGTILAAKLARLGIDALLIDGSGRAGKGVAYSTEEPAHVLNVPAESMSAWADDPDHFAQRFEAEGGHRRGFAPRRLFGRYLREILDRIIVTGHTRIDHSAAVGASREGDAWAVRLDDGRVVHARALALAIGNQMPQQLRGFEAAGARYVNNPWGAEAQAAVRDLAETGGSALLVGTGLTMVDLVQSLDCAGHRGRIVALSRRGQVPRSHAEYEPSPVELADVPAGNLIGLWRWLRRRAAEVGWRAAVDSLRPHSHALWQSLGAEQQRRFLRHARPWWDVHRHRIAPVVADTLAAAIAEGRLQIVAGKIQGVRSDPEGLDVEIRRRRASTAKSERFAYAFNCTGPLHAMGRTQNPLLRSLMDSGFARPDHLDIGFEVDGRSRVAGADRLWALGPLTKARYWEIVAVPDIRVQAAEVAEDIARELRS